LPEENKSVKTGSGISVDKFAGNIFKLFNGKVN
jgi:hypothetical protein